jgi:hypothetical protein
MNNATKIIIQISIGLLIPIILFFFGLFTAKAYTHYFDTHTRSEYGITNTYFQPSNLDDQTIREANKIIDEYCVKYESVFKEYEKCLKGVLDLKVDQIYGIVQNITRNSNSINSELIQQGVYKNDVPNPHTYLFLFLEDMTESFFDYSEKLCLVTLESNIELELTQIENRKCSIYQTSIYYSDLVNLRYKYITDYVENKIGNSDIKTEEYRATVKEEEYFHSRINMK